MPEALMIRRTGLLFFQSLVLVGCSGSSKGGAESASGNVDPKPSDASIQSHVLDSEATEGLSLESPSVEFRAANDLVRADEAVTLAWRAEHASACTASGGWAGAKPITGEEKQRPIDRATTYTLTCKGAGASVVRMISVAVEGPVTVRWQPPRENVDGTPIDDLAGYRIHYGARSADYSEHIDVEDPLVIESTFMASSGHWYIAMTAVDQEGRHSAVSNEVIRIVK